MNPHARSDAACPTASDGDGGGLRRSGSRWFGSLGAELERFAPYEMSEERDADEIGLINLFT